LKRYWHRLVLLEWALLLLLALYTFRYGVRPAWNEIHSDFPNYYVSARVILEGGEVDRLYDDVWFNEQIRQTGMEQMGKFSSFPPCTALVLLPLAGFEPLTAKRLWTLLNLGFLGLNVLLLGRCTGWPYRRAALLMLACGMGLTNNLRLGQFYLVLSAMIMGAFLLEEQKKSKAAGLLFGVGVALKYFGAIFLAVYLSFGRSRPVVWSVVAFLAVSFLAIGVIGWAPTYDYFSRIFLPHLDGRIVNQGGQAYAFQSFNSLFRNLFVAHVTNNPNPVFSWPVGFQLLRGLTYVLVLLPFAWLYKRAGALDQGLRLRLALMGITAMLLLPASATYHFLLLVFPVALLVSTVPQGALVFLLLAAYAAIGFLPYWRFTALDQGGLGVLWQYPRLWVMSAVWLLSMMVASQKIHMEESA